MAPPARHRKTPGIYLRAMFAARPAPPDRITSPHNPRIKEVLRLQEKSAERRRQGLTLVEGYRELTNAQARPAGPWPRCWCARSWLARPSAQALLPAQRHAPTNTYP
ncbi:MAG: hypothetical protein WKG07_10300 [Hymenobacter sp.]